MNRAISGRDVTKVLQRCIDRYPDLRVGQIIIAATQPREPFYIENDDLAHLLHTFLRRV